MRHGWIGMAAALMLAAMGSVQAQPSVPAITVAQLLAAPPAGVTVEVTGYVVETYLCPPCPPGADCKPCFSESAVYLADTPREPGSSAVPPMVGLGIAEPDKYVLGQHCRFQVTIADHPAGAVIGHIVGGGVLPQ